MPDLSSKLNREMTAAARGLFAAIVKEEIIFPVATADSE